MQLAHPEEQTGEVARWIRDPVSTSIHVLGHQTWWRQRHLLMSVMRHPMVAVKACHKSSKTFAAAELVIWWLLRYRDGKVITTSPTFPQIQYQLWPEIRRNARDSLIGFPEPLETALKLSDDSFALGRAAKDELAAAGWSGRILVIVDEAAGVRPGFFDALKGVMAGGRVHVLMLGNPTVLGGPYQEAFTINRAQWHCITLSAWDTPKLRPLLHPVGRPDPGLDPYGPPAQDEKLIKYLKGFKTTDYPAVPAAFRDLSDPEWIIQRWEVDGAGSLDWESRVMGRFPTHGENDLIAESWLEPFRYDKTDPGGRVDIGIDVAGGGSSETVVTVRCKGTILKQYFRKQADPEGWVLNIVRNWHKTGRLRYINVDSIGIGDGLWKILRKHFGDVKDHKGRHGVWGVNVGEGTQGATHTDRTAMAEKHKNLKAQLYWGLRDRANSKEGLRGVDDDETLGQLCTLRYFYNERGQIQMESKEKRQSRLRGSAGASPDRAESVMLAFAQPIVRTVPEREPVHF